MDSSYLKSATNSNNLPNFALPEIALLGRSNCGKSTLLNTLLGRKNLAITSQTPGRTQMINFFKVTLQKDSEVILADLPGYGYQKAGKGKAKEWEDLILCYLKRANIRYFLCLLDCRREFAAEELWLFERLYTQSNAQVALVLTKTDKINQNECKTRESEYEKQLASLGFKNAAIFSVSCLKSKGIKELQEYMFSDLKR